MSTQPNSIPSTYLPASGGENKSKYVMPSLATKKSASGAGSTADPTPYVCAACKIGRCSNCVSLRCQHSCHTKEVRGLEQVKRERQRELSTHRGAPSRF